MVREIATEVHPIVQLLVEARKKRHLSQYDIARAMTVHQSLIARLETRAGNPNLSTVERYADALGYQLEYTLLPR